MANPNIVNVATINGESVGFNLTATTTTTLLTVSSNKLLKVNRITCANVDGPNAADVSLSVEKQNEYKVYRQELRDITKTYKSPADVKWPTVPSR